MVLLHNPRANYESPINVTLDLFHIETSQSRRCQDDEPSDTSCAITLTCCRDLSYCGCTKFPSAADNYLQTKYCLGFCLISPPRRSLFLRSSALIFFFFPVSGKCLEEVCPVVDIQKHLHCISPDSVFIFRSLFLSHSKGSKY